MNLFYSYGIRINLEKWVIGLDVKWLYLGTSPVFQILAEIGVQLLASGTMLFLSLGIRNHISKLISTTV